MMNVKLETKEDLDKLISDTVDSKDLKKCMLKNTQYNINFPQVPYCTCKYGCIDKKYISGKNHCYVLLDHYAKVKYDK